MQSTRRVLNATSRLSGKGRASARPATTIGISSLLVVFLILCLVTFAVLTLSGAQNDYDFSQRLAQRKLAETAAGNAAQRIWAQVDRRLAECVETGGALDVSDLGASLENDTIFWETTVDDRQSLMVQLIITEDGPHYCEIVAWKLVPAAERTEGTLPLLDPEGA